jgi:MFS family permease
MYVSAILIGILSCVAFIIITKEYRIAVSFDSVRYISISKNILGGEGIKDFSGRYNADQPLLYPMLLAAISFLGGFDPLNAAWILNCVLVGLTVFMITLLLLDILQNKWLGYLGILLITFSLPQSKVIFWAWTEPLFIFLVLAFFYAAHEFIKKNTLKNMLFLGFIAGLAMVTRYIGIILIPVGVIVLIAFSKLPLNKRVWNAIIYSFASSIMLAINLFFNYINTQTFFGPRSKSIFTLSQNLSFVSEVFFNWFLPEFITGHRSLILIFGIFLGLLIMKNLGQDNFINNGFLQKSRIFLLFIFIYISFLIYSATTTAFDRISDRLLSPVFIPVYIVILIFFDYFLYRSISKFKSNFWFNIIAGFLFLTIFLTSFYNVPPIVQRVSRNGEGYTSNAWKNSELIAYITKNQLKNCEWYSNAPEIIYFFTGKYPKWILYKSIYNSPESVHEVSNFVGKWPPNKETACVIWFKRIDRTYLP